MKKYDVRVKKLHEDAVIPTYGSNAAAGFDLYALEEVVIQPGETKLIKTGLAFEIPNGFEMQVRPRSGLSKKTKLRISNSPGTIDADYRGEVGILVDHIGASNEEMGVLSTKGEAIDSKADQGSYVIAKHDRIAQGVLQQVPQAIFLEVESLNDTSRGSGGFGSTGN
ncbi:deoxyuridine 5'-triphosphate nucleotidohydrolase [Geomicrobium sp. JCM 19037]|uniref:dUTP diphosphatase n=1 Tax=unclassified Geomicrobium TaxID=2628951 RepID=UPI00045F46D6|nr:dUTP diphosphatase [Geomicrobium sp. JCM 19037]GAK06301.1 deoxyuridine 5'-triphosphate nucleotidohydrolase [Geomicrobium sp. JCM 19037]